MGNFTFAYQFATGTAVKYSEDTSFPASNVTDYTHPHRPWKSLGDIASGTTYVGLYFGSSPISLAGLVIDRINVSTVHIQHSADGSAWSDSVTNPITIYQDRWDERYKAYVPLAAWSAKYIRVLAGTNTPNGMGGTKMEVGSLLAITTAYTWTVNPSGILELTPRQAVRLNNDFDSGQIEPVELGHKYAELAINAPVMPLASEVDIALWSRISGAAPIVFYRNLSSTAEVYICYRTGFTTTRQTGPNSYDMGQLVFREVC